MNLSRFITGETFVYLLLGLTLLLVAIFGLGGYYAALGSDHYGLVHFAEHLAEGHLFSSFPVYNWFKPDWGRDEYHFVLHGNYITDGSRMYCKYAIGYPLVLALGIRLFGLNSVYLANIFFLLLLLWFFFKLAQTIFKDWKYGPYLALTGMLLLLVLINKAWSLSLKPSRDLPALTFLVAGLFFGIKALGRLPRVNWFCLVLGGFCLGYSVAVRLPYVLAGLPVGLYLLVKAIGKAPWKKVVAVILLAGFFFLVGLLPVLTQNYLVEGNPFRPPRPEITKKAVVSVKEVKSPPPLWLPFILTTGPDTLRYFGELYGVSLTALMLIGLAAGWKSPEIRYLCLGLPLLFIVFYSMWVHLMVRYMIIAQPFLLILIAAGVGKVLDPGARKWVLWLGPVLIGADILVRVSLNREHGLGPVDFFALAFTISLWLVAARESGGWRTPSRYLVLVCVLFVLFLAKFGPAWFSSRRIFQLPQARKFGRDVDRLVPADSVIFATKPISQLISLFTGSYSIRSFEIERMKVGLKEGCRRMLDRGTSLFLIDATGGRRDGGKYIPILRKYFDLTPVGTLKGEDYCLTGQFGKPFCAIYEITDWSKKEVEAVISGLAEGEGYLMSLNARTIWADYGDRSRVEVSLNGERLAARIRDGLNFLYLPARLLHYPRSTLTFASDQPLPRRMNFEVRSVWEPYTITFGERATVPEYFLVNGFAEFHWQDRYYRRLLWETPGTVKIPTIIVPDTRIIGQLDIRNGQKIPRPVGLKVMLDGKEIADLDLSGVGNWEEARFVIPDDAVSSVESELGLLAYPRAGYEIPYPDDEWWGALSLKAVIVKRWLTKVFLDTPIKGDYFVSFIIKPDPGADNCREPFRVRVDGRVVRDGVRNELQRLFLAPDRVRVPVTKLEVESALPGCPALMESRPVVVGPEGELVIDLGGERDWAYLEDGFYLPELFDDKQTVRWTAETATLVVPLFSREGKEPVVTIHLRGGHPPAFPPESRKLDVLLDGIKIETIPLKGGERSYQCRLPSAGPEARLARLQLVTPPWDPRRYGMNDQRLLGVLIDRVVIEYRD